MECDTFWTLIKHTCFRSSKEHIHSAANSSTRSYIVLHILTTF